MTDAREIIARQVRWGEVDRVSVEVADNVISALASSGFRILGPDEIDGPTVEKCSVEMEVNWGHVCTPELRDAIRALKEKQT